MSWFRVTLDVSADDVELVSDRLMELGSVSVTISGGGSEDDLVIEPAPGRTPLWDRNRLLALFALDTDLSEMRRSLSGCLDADTLMSLDVGFVDEEDWLQAWRPHAVQHLFGKRLWVAPKDAEVEVSADQKVLRLEPGLAFGTGGHATTHMCLEWLARQSLAGLKVMDYGCGSGILSIAAIILGAADVWAVDHDPQALLATKDNAAYNGIGPDQLTVIGPEELALGPEELAPELAEVLRFDVVLANILANPLIELAQELVTMTRAGGKLVLSGLLVEQTSRVKAAYPDIVFEQPVREEAWMRLVGTKQPDVR